MKDKLFGRQLTEALKSMRATQFRLDEDKRKAALMADSSHTADASLRIAPFRYRVEDVVIDDEAGMVEARIVMVTSVGKPYEQEPIILHSIVDESQILEKGAQLLRTRAAEFQDNDHAAADLRRYQFTVVPWGAAQVEFSAEEDPDPLS